MSKEKQIPQGKINWTEIIIFYVIAVAVSAPFRLGIVKPGELIPLPFGLEIFYRILRGIGPAIGFLFVYYVLKSKVERKFSFLGKNKLYSIIAVVIIPVTLAIAGVSNVTGLNQHYFGFLTGILLILYALGEEYGWRGYLQQALEPLKEPYRILAIAVLWYFWHLNFLLPDFSVGSHLVFFGFLLLGSWGLMKISRSSLSILFTAGVHISFNILSDRMLDGNKKIIVILALALIWAALIISLSKSKNKGKPELA